MYKYLLCKSPKKLFPPGGFGPQIESILNSVENNIHTDTLNGLHLYSALVAPSWYPVALYTGLSLTHSHTNAGCCHAADVGLRILPKDTMNGRKM